MGQVEVTWHSASGCSSESDRVEVAEVMIGGESWFWVRDSGDPEIILRFTTGEWEAFTAGVHGGEFDE